MNAHLHAKRSIKTDYTVVIVDVLGEMAEWLKAPVSKTGICICISRVRIPLSPPNIIQIGVSPPDTNKLINYNNLLPRRGARAAASYCN